MPACMGFMTDIWAVQVWSSIVGMPCLINSLRQNVPCGRYIFGDNRNPIVSRLYGILMLVTGEGARGRCWHWCKNIYTTSNYRGRENCLPLIETDQRVNHEDRSSRPGLPDRVLYATAYRWRTNFTCGQQSTRWSISFNRKNNKSCQSLSYFETNFGRNLVCAPFITHESGWDWSWARWSAKWNKPDTRGKVDIEPATLQYYCKGVCLWVESLLSKRSLLPYEVCRLRTITAYLITSQENLDWPRESILAR